MIILPPTKKAKNRIFESWCWWIHRFGSKRFDAKAASQAAKLGQPLAKVTKSSKLTQPFTELLSQTVDHASAEAGAEGAAPKGGSSLLGKLNLKSFVAKKAKEPSSQPA